MASLSTCHLGLWLGWQILLNLVKSARLINATAMALATELNNHAFPLEVMFVLGIVTHNSACEFMNYDSWLGG